MNHRYEKEPESAGKQTSSGLKSMNLLTKPIENSNEYSPKKFYAKYENIESFIK
ncbi:MAG: hypothetical protein LBV71_11765 [Prevotella sp.]|jgi:hypothetical protein|nr:hypothetical protein [Prevotella sp.]